MSDFYNKINQLQVRAKCPKNQFNSFGKYKYRSCEDILEGVKPVLKELGLTLTISDEIVVVADRIYVKATATITDGKESLSATGYAREAESKKGMDASQVTGAASSYARKFSLGGLLTLDDNKDADATNQHDQNSAVRPLDQKKEPPKSNQNSSVPTPPKIQGIEYERIENGGRTFLVAKGKTYGKEDLLKESGFAWNPKQKCFYIEITQAA